MEAYLELASVVFGLVLLLVAFAVGEWIERRHYRSIRRREERWRKLPAITLASLPGAGTPVESELVMGHVVISVDHFKRFVARLRQLFGGRIRTYESLMDRARREAILRLKQKAIEERFHAVVNVRLETARLASGRNGNGTAGIEVLAFGTGIRLQRDSA